MYNVIAFSPEDQIPPKHFVSINSTDIYISSNKFVMNGPLSMEVRFNTFSHCHDDVKFSTSILKNLGYRAPPRQNKNETRAFKKNRFERDLACLSQLYISISAHRMSETSPY
jgi:hypothetical protein